jgi:hypothetical protein
MGFDVPVGGKKGGRGSSPAWRLTLAGDKVHRLQRLGLSMRYSSLRLASVAGLVFGLFLAGSSVASAQS